MESLGGAHVGELACRVEPVAVEGEPDDGVVGAQRREARDGAGRRADLGDLVARLATHGLEVARDVDRRAVGGRHQVEHHLVDVAAVLYVFRTLVDDDIPLNAGCLKPLKVVIPEGSMLNPHPPASVVAGNVETSTCITNALYGALGSMAAAQCTMNNFTFGNDQYQYYETIAGGSGAGPDFDGTSVVQTHMTNSRLTDPEVLETRFPVRLDSYEIREGSGGAGRTAAATAECAACAFSSP